MTCVTCLSVCSARVGRAGRRLAAVLLVAGLAACGSTPNTGAYYQNDGPGSRSASEFVNAPDAVPRDEPVLTASLRPYVVFDRQYIPLTERQPFRQSGVASWYGKQFQGKPTAMGEPYDMYKLTAAHPTLPLPSYVRVRNLDNNRSVVVRVNDRGPFSNGRIIDLSFAAAAKLGYVERGTTLVSIEVVDPAVVAMEKKSPEPAPAPVQLSARKAHSVTPRNQAVPASLPVPAFTLAQPQPVKRGNADAAPVARSRDTGGQRTLRLGSGRATAAAAPAPVQVSPVVGAAAGSTVAVRVETLQDAGLRPAVPESDQPQRRESTRDPLKPRDWSKLADDTPVVRAERQQIAAISAEARRVELNERSAASEDPLIFLQFGAYSTEKAAREDLYRYSGSFNSLFLPVQIIAERKLFKIQAGPFESNYQAEAAIKRFRAESDLQPFYVYR